MSANGPAAETRLFTRMDTLRQDWGHAYEIEDGGDHVRARRREPGAGWIAASGPGYLRKALEADDAQREAGT